MAKTVVGIVRLMALGRLDHVGAAAQNRRARVAVAALFLTNGALFANLLPRYPEIKADLAAVQRGLRCRDRGVLGRRTGRRVGGGREADPPISVARVAVAGSIGIAVFMFVATLAPSAVALASALFIAGASDAVTDVGQNAHALRVQRNYGRSIINSFHAVWSVGAVLGGAMGAAAIALHIPRTTHLAVSAAVFSAVVLAAYPFLLHGPDQDDHPSARTRGGRAARFRDLRDYWSCWCSSRSPGRSSKTPGSSWATLYLQDSLGAPGRDRGVRLHRDGRLPVRRAADRRPAGGSVRGPCGRQGRRIHRRGQAWARR